MGLCSAAFYGFLPLVAFSDAWHRCPGIQSIDAVGMTVMGVVVVILGFLGALAGQELPAVTTR